MAKSSYMTIKSILYTVIVGLIIAFQPITLSGQEFQVKSQQELSGATDSMNITHTASHHGPYSLDYKREIILLGSGVVMGISGLVLVNNATPLTAEEIAQLDPNDINPFDRHSVGQYREVKTGDVLLYTAFLLPLTFMADKGTKRDWKTLGVIGIEVLLIQAGLNAIVKGLTLRTRPYVYDPNTPMAKKSSKDARVSFYSGHTSTTAAITFYVARVFSDYLSDDTAKTFIWAGAAVYPALVAYLRRDSGRHFRTDVMTGYVIGAAIGYFIPELHKVSQNERLSVNYLYSGKYAAIGISYKF